MLRLERDRRRVQTHAPSPAISLRYAATMSRIALLLVALMVAACASPRTVPPRVVASEPEIVPLTLEQERQVFGP